MAANRTFSLSEANALFKIKYDKLSENVYNSANVLLGRVKKSYDFVGKQMQVSIPQSFAGGVGSGSLPTANTALYDEAVISAKKVYAVVEIDRETIKAALKDEGSYVRATKEVVKKGVESYMRNMSRILFNDGTGALGTLNANATGTAAAPVCVISDATWKEANFEERDLLNVDSGTDLFEITSVDPDNQTVTLSRLAGSVDLTSTGSGSVLYMQGSKDNDPEGLKGILDATSGSKYTIPVGRRWQSYQLDASSAAISADLMNKVMLNVEKRCGKAPNLIVCSYKQYEKLLNTLEDHKRYSLSPREASLKGKISFNGIEFMSTSGPIGVFPERFCEDDRMYFLNDNHIHIHHRPDFGWFDDDGTVFLRKASADQYEARYGGYFQIYINPCFHGVLDGLSTT
jgi:hypothetical protein